MKHATRPASRAVLSGTSRAHRKTLRQRLGSLFSLRVAAVTARRYARAYAAVTKFLAYHSYEVGSFARLDSALAFYIGMCWEEGEPRNFAADAIAAIQFFLPAARGRLHLSWSLCSAWNRHELPARALPLTPELLAAVCGAFRRAGLDRLALGSLFGFAVLARTGELLTLRREQVSFDRTSVVVSFTNTKRGQRLGIDEGVVVRDPITALALRALCVGLQPGDLILGCTERQMRAAWAMVARVLRLERMSLRPYSLRRGGATHLFRRTGSLHAVAEAGRWASLPTARRYISDAVAAITALELDAWQQANFSVLAQEFKHWLATLEGGPGSGAV